MKRGILFISIVFAGTFAACSRNEAKVSGRLVGRDSVKLYLEQISPGRQVLIDSTITDDKGSYAFRVKLPQGQATIYNLRTNDEIVPLLLSAGEHVKIQSVGTLSRNYTVEGSEGTEQMRRLKRILSDGASRLDSILTVYGRVPEQRRAEVGSAYTKEYYAIKREHITFIASQPGSLAALYALFQRLPNDNTLFNGENDIIYYRLVADSVSQIYPDSPYVIALQKEIAEAERGMGVADLLNEKLAQESSGYPDLSMPDIYGDRRKLSDLDGKVILLDFWMAGSAENRMLNAELRETYDRFRERGFEVYQVAVDTDRAVWVTAVQSQKLPWVSVNDLRGPAGIAFMAYNVQRLPANFLIDTNGDIVGKNLYGDKLADKLQQLLK